jgi:hypothetical protein
VSREYATLTAGLALSWVGNGFQQVALPVAVAVSGGTAAQLGAVLSSTILTRLAFVLVGGVVADRISPRVTMVASDAVRLVSTVGLALLFATGHWTTPALIALSVVTSAAGTFFDPAYIAMRVAIVPPSQRTRAAGLTSMVRTFTGFGAPLLGGFVVALAGPTAGFVVNAVSFLGSIVAVLLVPAARVVRPPREETSFVRQLRDGFGAVRERDWLWSGMVGAGLYHLGNGALLVLTPLIAVNRLGGGAAYGAIVAAEGLGGFVGAWLATRHHVRRPLLTGWLVLQTMPLWALSFAWPPLLWTVIAGSAVGYAGLMYYDVRWETAQQLGVPVALIARVLSWDYLVSYIMLPLGSALAAPASHWLGERAVIVSCAAILCLGGLLPLTQRGTRVWEVPAEAR